MSDAMHAAKMAEDRELVPAQSKRCVDACAFPNWRHIPQLAARLPPSEVLPLPRSFVCWLLSDGVSVSSGSRAVPRTYSWPLPEQVDSAFFANGGGKLSIADNDEDDDDQGDAPSDMRQFPELEQQIDDAIAGLGGAVLPKLDFSSPKDATWVSPDGSMRCTNADEVALLLRCSDSAQHDLQHAYAHCDDFQGGLAEGFAHDFSTPYPGDHSLPSPSLVLKAWQAHIQPSMEFRCFVRGGELACVCQRDIGNFYPFLISREVQADALATMKRFHEHVFKQCAPLKDCCVDVHVNGFDEKVDVLDINPYGGATLPLLYDLSEIERNAQAVARSEMEPQIRVVEKQGLIRPSLKLGVPVEFYDTSTGSALEQLMRIQREQQQHK
jgi:hypothetical protein